MVRIIALSAFVLIACGRRPGVSANQTYFWRVTSSEVAFGDNCSDNTRFRMANGPLRLESNSYVIYRGSEDATQAALMSCTMLEAATCAPAMSGIVFDVAGAELSYSTEMKTPTGRGACSILNAQSWILTDMVSTIDVRIIAALSLVDDPSSCDRVEADAKAEAPNMNGIQGCTVSFTVGGSSP